ncbi:helix-turn-helix domain-containing protein [Bifidobacterium aesculapii]|uniref:helix-turn-helix domain-containing protein n=1 Tax=Bifidobacterium aesculapii TaxID=1329411 RepID=UPI0022A92557|nr:helix-turn-helix transcriptional regulator [Bifidobacterium aesculapii]
MVERRKEHGMSQTALASKSGVSLSSLRRFEQSHEISLTSLINIAFALGCEGDFEGLFAHPYYRDIDAVVAARGDDGKVGGKVGGKGGKRSDNVSQ